jgi:hypothetical protein
MPGSHSHGLIPQMGAQSPVSHPHPAQSPSFNKNGCQNNSNNNNLGETNRNYLEKITQEAKKAKLCNAKKIDKIAENLRYGTSSTPESPSAASATKSFLEHFNQIAQKSPQLLLPPPTSSQSSFPLSPSLATSAAFQSFLTADNKVKPMENLLMRANEQMPTMPYQDQNKKPASGAAAGTGTTTKIPNSKLFAKCFICSKLLSNQYNLRVHLETHQNMRSVVGSNPYKNPCEKDP